jgi:hypothetical protein
VSRCSPQGPENPEPRAQSLETSAWVGRTGPSQGFNEPSDLEMYNFGRVHYGCSCQL